MKLKILRNRFLQCGLGRMNWDLNSEDFIVQANLCRILPKEYLDVPSGCMASNTLHIRTSLRSPDRNFFTFIMLRCCQVNLQVIWKGVNITPVLLRDLVHLLSTTQQSETHDGVKTIVSGLTPQNTFRSVEQFKHHRARNFCGKIHEYPWCQPCMLGSCNTPQ